MSRVRGPLRILASLLRRDAPAPGASPAPARAPCRCRPRSWSDPARVDSRRVHFLPRPS
jgi:hypothetical protein